MYTCSIALTRCWIVDPLNPTLNPIVCGTRRQGDWTDTVDGEVRVYSGDVKKVVTFGTTMRQLPITLVAVSSSALIQLRQWKGRTVLVRTAQGEKLFGTILSLAVHDHLRTAQSSDGRAFTVTITVQEVTYTEAV